ncbi:MAG: bifunctional phosphopantothenoylcysteine decarboxylase/phosphopantothenate--cysteine ligase CoaBC [bacterium]
MLQRRRILVAVTGGIAAYKICELTRLLLKNGALVQVAMTEAATHFVGAITFEALTGRKVALNLFAGEEEGSGHLDLTRGLDLMVIAPATANSIGKLAAGVADDLISTTALTLTCPLLLCPAMNPKMFTHPAVQENLQRLKARGVQVLEPVAGAMAHPLEEAGVGRLPEPTAILDAICRLLPASGALSGKTVVVTAGPTREALDPVRVISNLSSGKMGFALAAEARRRGARVHLISGPVEIPPPPGISVISVNSTEEMKEAVLQHFKDSQALIMAAAPADFKPATISAQKIKKDAARGTFRLNLQKTPDILQEAARLKGNRIIVGFALETEPGLSRAQRKLQEKNLDLIILNHPYPEPNTGLGKDAIQATIIHPDGSVEALPIMSKAETAAAIFDCLQLLWDSPAMKPQGKRT